MAARRGINIFKRLHFRRTLTLLIVSFWITLPGLSLADKPSHSNTNTADDFAEFEETAPPSAKTKQNVVLSPEKRIETLLPKVKANPSDSKSAIELAHAYFDKKDYKKATPLLWKFIDKLDKSDFYVLMHSHNELGQSDELMKVAGLLIARNEKDFEAHHYLARSYTLKKKDKEALENYKKAIEINSKYFPSYLGIAEIYERRKNLYELRALYQDMLQAFGPMTEILTQLCHVNSKDGFLEVAEKYCRQAIQKDPSIPENHVDLGLVTLQSGDKPKAKEIFRATAEKFPKSEVAQYQYATFLDDEKNYLDSYKAYKLCVDNNPKSEKCLVGYGNAAFQIQKLDEAHAAYKKLCRVNRSYGIHVRRALASLRNGGSKEWTTRFQEVSDACSM